MQQGLVGARTRPYSTEEYQCQFSEFENNAQTALSGIPVSLVAHTVQPFTGTESPSAVLHPMQTDVDCEGNNCMAHMQLEHANFLLSQVTENKNTPNQPAFLNNNEPCHVFSWAMYLMDQMQPLELFQQLLQSQLISQNEAMAMADSEVDLQKRIHQLVHELTPIRLSCVEGKKRVETSSYVFSENPRFIGLNEDEGLGDHASRAAVRNNLLRVNHPVQVFTVPDVIGETGHTPEVVFSAGEVALCNCIAVERQVNLEKAVTLSLCDKMCSYARIQSSHAQNPWHASTAGEYLRNEHRTAVSKIFPIGLNKDKALTLQNLPTIRNNVDISVRKLLENKLKLMDTGNDRIRYMQSTMPPFFQDCMDQHLVATNFADWRDSARKKTTVQKETLQKCSCTIATYFAVAFGRFWNIELHRFLDSWHGQHFAIIHSTTTDLSEDINHNLALACMLLENYYLPALSLVCDIEEQERPKKSSQKWCHWTKFNRECAVYQQLSQLYGNEAVLPVIDGSVMGVQSLCFLLCTLVKNGVVRAENHPDLEQMAVKLVPTDYGSRIFPGCSLELFAPRFLHAGDDPKEPTNWFELRDFAERQPDWLADQWRRHGKNLSHTLTHSVLFNNTPRASEQQPEECPPPEINFDTNKLHPQPIRLDFEGDGIEQAVASPEPPSPHADLNALYCPENFEDFVQNHGWNEMDKGVGGMDGDDLQTGALLLVRLQQQRRSLFDTESKTNTDGDLAHATLSEEEKNLSDSDNRSIDFGNGGDGSDGSVVDNDADSVTSGAGDGTVAGDGSQRSSDQQEGSAPTILEAATGASPNVMENDNNNEQTATPPNESNVSTTNPPRRSRRTRTSTINYKESCRVKTPWTRKKTAPVKKKQKKTNDAAVSNSNESESNHDNDSGDDANDSGHDESGFNMLGSDESGNETETSEPEDKGEEEEDDDDECERKVKQRRLNHPMLVGIELHGTDDFEMGEIKEIIQGKSSQFWSVLREAMNQNTQEESLLVMDLFRQSAALEAISGNE